MPATAAPRSDNELLERARALAGLTVGELGARIGIAVPDQGVRGKGVAGMILERVLGATAASRAEPDFVELGVELKTIPLNANGRPKESTFVASIALSAMADTDWEHSIVLKKLSKVLFLPVEAASQTPLRHRRIGLAYLWVPTERELDALKADWERLAEMIAAGHVEQITGHLGEVLQVRPKGPSGRARRRAADEDGDIQWTMPRGFYLRPAFTGAVLARLRGRE